MEKKLRSERFLKKRKLLLVLPVLVLPFLTIGFYALGGGSGIRGPVNISNAGEGLNIELPSADVKEDVNATKLSFYDKAEALQKEREKEIQHDPYFRLDEDELAVQEPDAEEKILEKISMLEKEINKPAPAPRRSMSYDTRPVYNKQLSGDVERLEEMMRWMNEKNEDDPEMRQLDTMLEKIMDVQHPDRVIERLKEESAEKKTMVLQVRPANELAGGTNTGFYGLESQQDQFSGNSIEVIVHETQTLVNGSMMKMRLVNDIHLNGIIVPKDNFVYGIATLNGERLHVKIESIRFQNSLYPVELQVYDMDGMQGIYIPGAISRDVAKQSADNSLRLLEAGTLDPSFKAQVTAAGIQTAKNFLSRKVKLIRVTVKAGYKLLLRNDNL